MNMNQLFDSHSAIRLAVTLVFSGGLLLLYARFLFGPFPGGRG
jgi:hypothetical protein